MCRNQRTGAEPKPRELEETLASPNRISTNAGSMPGPTSTCRPGCSLGKLRHMPVIGHCHPCTPADMQAPQLSKTGGIAVVLQCNPVCDSFPSREAAGRASSGASNGGSTGTHWAALCSARWRRRYASNRCRRTVDLWWNWITWFSVLAPPLKWVMWVSSVARDIVCVDGCWFTSPASPAPPCRSEVSTVVGCGQAGLQMRAAMCSC